MGKLSKAIIFILLTVTILNLSLFLYKNSNFFLRRFDPEYMGKLYSESQYVIGEKSKGGIGDDGLYAFAGYYYLFQGGDVSAVNFEHPPLGKYLIGLSILFTGNENIINIFYFIFLLILTYKISKLISSDTLTAVFSVGVLSFDALFLDNLIRSLLDLPFTLFFIGGVYFFLLGFRKANYFYLSFFFWGLSFATRFFPFFVVLYLYMLILVIIYKRNTFKTYILSSLLVPFIYLVTHASFFFYHPSIIEFLRHKKWMLAWFTGTPVLIGNIWRNILTGTYLDSTKKEAINEHWQLSIPIIVILALTNIKKKMIYGFCFIYVFYLTFLTGGQQKFLMPIYPLLIILAVDNLRRVYSIITTWRKRK